MKSYIKYLFIFFVFSSSLAYSAIFTVTTTANTGVGSLRQAITNANSNGIGLDNINFNIPGSAPFIITLSSVLPTITGAVNIDATTQPSYNGTPLIQLFGNGMSGSALNFQANTSNSVVKGLHINSFINSPAVYINNSNAFTVMNNVISNSSIGLYIFNSSNNIIKGNKIGTNLAGTASTPGTQALVIETSSNNTIGGNSSTDGNLIVNSGGSTNGALQISNCSFSIFKGNKINTDVNGLIAIGNSGVNFSSSNNNTIGGSLAGEGNIIAAERISFGSSSSFNTIKGNKIGIDITGLNIIQGLVSTIGINIISTSNRNIIGGSNVGDGNIIGGASLSGIYIGFQSDSNEVKGNKIGTDINGSINLGNPGVGIVITSSNRNIIGGAGSNEGNLISGNGSGSFGGIYISNSKYNQVKGNKIGTNMNGTAILANNGSGIVIQGASHKNAIGGTNLGEGNIISGNLGGLHGHGIEINNSDSTIIFGNKIGTDLSGTAALGNSRSGILISLSKSTIIGGSSPGQQNIIAFNGEGGVNIFGSSSVPANKNIISRNPIYGSPNNINLNLGSSFPGNNGKPSPVITAVVPGSGNASVSGTSQPNDIIELFMSNVGGIDAMQLLSITTANGSGNWTIGNLNLSSSNKVVATATDANNNTSEFSRGVGCVLSANAGADAELCFGQGVILGGDPTISNCGNPLPQIIISWSPALGLSAVDISNPVATPDTTTKYYIEVYDAAGSTLVAQDSVLVTVHPLPTISAFGDTAICIGRSANIGALGTGSFSWAPATGLNNPNSQNPVATPNVSTNYIVTLTNNFNCTAQDNVSVTVLPIPAITISPDVTICRGSSVPLEAIVQATNIQWSPTLGLDNPFSAYPIASPQNTTLYIVTASNNAQCSSQASVTVGISETPFAAFNHTFPGLTVNFSTTTTLPANFVWNFGDGGTSTLPNPSHTYSQAGTYHVCLTVNNSCGRAIYCEDILVKIADSNCCN